MRNAASASADAFQLAATVQRGQDFGRLPLRRAIGTTECDIGESAALVALSAAARCSRIIFLNRFFRSVLNDGVY